MGAGDGGYAYQGRQFTPIYNLAEGGAAVRRIKHQPSPLGLRVHPSTLLLRLNGASRCIPSPGGWRGLPCLGETEPAAGCVPSHMPSLPLRVTAHRGVTKLPGRTGPRGHPPAAGMLLHLQIQRQSQPLIPCSSWPGEGAASQGSLPAPAPPRAGGTQLPQLQKKPSGLSSPLPLQNRREKGPFGTSQATS